MRDDVHSIPTGVVIVTLDSHAAGPVARVAPRLAPICRGWTSSVHAAAEWAEDAAARLRAAKADIAQADI